MLVDMAWKAPTKHLKRKDLLDNRRFFRLLSEQCGFKDEKIMRHMYQAFVGVVNDELRHNKFVRLPQLGDMALVPQKPRPALIGSSHRQVRIGSRNVLKFYPKEQWRRQINARQGAPVIAGPAPTTTQYHDFDDAPRRTGPESAGDYISPFYRD